MVDNFLLASEITKNRLDSFDKFKIAVLNSWCSLATADHYLRNLTEIVFGFSESLLFHKREGSQRIYGSLNKKNVKKYLTKS